MISKKVLENIRKRYVNSPTFQTWCDIILQDLERLEQLEIANKNNENLVKENVRLVNENLLLRDKLNNLKTKEE